MGSLSFPSSSVEDTRHINWLSSSLYASVAVFLEDSWLLITLSASANQHITNNILCKKPEEWLAYLPLLLKSIISRAKDWWILKETFKRSNCALSLMKRDISCHQMRQIHLNPGCGLKS